VANAHASDNVSGFYLGAGLGTTEADIDYVDESAIDESGATYKIIGGYQFNRIVTLEAQYTSYGKVGFGRVSTVKGYSWDKATSFSVAANLGYTFDNGIRPFGTIGLSALKLNQSTKVWEDSGSALRVGFGVDYTPDFYPSMTFRAAIEADGFTLEDDYYRDADVTLGSGYVAAYYRF
jgi:opacity protein-like surface antigen